MIDMSHSSLLIDEELNLVYGHFFFVDIVGLSETKYSTKLQTKKIETLNKSIKECKAFIQTQRENMLVLSTGDGMAIGFFQSSAEPLSLAIECGPEPMRSKVSIFL